MIIAKYIKEREQSARIMAKVVDLYDNPIPGVTVDFALDGMGSINRTTAVTDSTGNVTVTFTTAADQTGRATITLSCPDYADVDNVDLYFDVTSGTIGPFQLDESALDSQAWLVSDDWIAYQPAYPDPIYYDPATGEILDEYA